MTAIKDNVLQIIENGITANDKQSFCTCQFNPEAIEVCNYCKVDKGLRMALLHIRATSRKDAELRMSMERVQLEIEKKVMKLLAADN
jgi:hypothetical protein